VTEELWRQGITVNHKTVEALMSALGLQGLSGRRKVKTTRQGPRNAPAPDLVKRDFSADEPNQLLVRQSRPGVLRFRSPACDGYRKER
jgi:transposase InsO family protein